MWNFISHLHWHGFSNDTCIGVMTLFIALLKRSVENSQRTSWCQIFFVKVREQWCKCEAGLNESWLRILWMETDPGITTGHFWKHLSHLLRIKEVLSHVSFEHNLCSALSLHHSSSFHCKRTGHIYHTEEQPVLMSTSAQIPKKSKMYEMAAFQTRTQLRVCQQPAATLSSW